MTWFYTPDSRCSPSARKSDAGVWIWLKPEGDTRQALSPGARGHLSLPGGCQHPGPELHPGPEAPAASPAPGCSVWPSTELRMPPALCQALRQGRMPSPAVLAGIQDGISAHLRLELSPALRVRVESAGLQGRALLGISPPLLYVTTSDNPLQLGLCSQEGNNPAVRSSAPAQINSPWTGRVAQLPALTLVPLPAHRAVAFQPHSRALFVPPSV